MLMVFVRHTVSYCSRNSVYIRLLTSCDKSVRQDFVIPVNRDRREMVGNVILYFSVLSSAFKLKTPLPPYLPPAEKSRQRLVRSTPPSSDPRFTAIDSL